MKHSNTGAYWTKDIIERYACLGDEVMDLGEAIEELEIEGFEIVYEFEEGLKPVKDSTMNEMIHECVQALNLKFSQLLEYAAKSASSLELIARQAPLLTPPIGIEAVAKLAGVKAKTVYRWKAEGSLKPLSDNRPLLFSQSVVSEFLSQRRRSTR